MKSIFALIGLCIAYFQGMPANNSLSSGRYFSITPNDSGDISNFYQRILL